MVGVTCVEEDENEYLRTGSGRISLVQHQIDNLQISQTLQFNVELLSKELLMFRRYFFCTHGVELLMLVFRLTIFEN